MFQLLYKTHKEETVVRRNFGNQASRLHPSENKSSPTVLGLTSIGLVLVVSLRDRETNGSDKVCESGVPLCSTKLFSLMSLFDFYGFFRSLIVSHADTLGLVTHSFLTKKECVTSAKSVGLGGRA